MAAVENILVNNTATRGEAQRAPSKVPFAPFLVSEMEARISDLAAPRDTTPANTDRFERRSREVERPRDDHGDQGPDDNRVRFDHHQSTSPRDDRADRAESARRGGTTDRLEPTSDTPAKQPTTTEPAEEPRADRSDAGDETRISRNTNTETRTSEATKETPVETPVQIPVEIPVDAPPRDLDQATNNGPIDLAVVAPNNASLVATMSSEAPEAPALPVSPSGPAIDAFASNASAKTGVQGAAVPVNAAAGGAGSSGLTPDQTPIEPNPNGATTSPKSASKISLPGMTPSNDDAPSKIGSNVPQVVRDVQTIVSRPANAVGGNLVQAQQQSELAPARVQSPASQPANAAPLAHNAGQGTPLHVGADGGQNPGQGTGQGTGQAGGQTPGGANGQQSNGQAGNNPSGSGNGQMTGAQIAGAPTDPTAAATQQAARNFQETLARGPGPGGARGPASAVGDVASTARVDASTASAGGAQGTLSSDPASRAAQASAAHRPPPSAPTEQVSVRLKKAVENGESKLRIQLRPHDLGRVEVKLDIAGDGRTKALILAERPETLELLQRDSRVLERALQDAGLKTDQNSLSFDLQGRGGEERTQQADQGTDDGNGLAADPESDADIDPNEQPIPVTAIGLAPDGSVNFLA